MSTKIILIIIATINPNEREALAQYLEEMNVFYTEVGAIPISKHKISEVIMGEETPNLVAILEFPDRASVDRVFNSKRYQKLVALREKAFIKVSVVLSEDIKQEN